ncbi:riboflavin synthase [Adlercreutzia sp. ZJ304]|uniref:riboflavin synthase n=1 Tax=Adlercreutzia sp. ZJ304 TaxID=2709791 RepID=UPI0013EB6172|nr:riboflavin synthase [Adlercreutzia sp. ZJ304]
MFTGIIEEVGSVRSIKTGARGATISIAAQSVLSGTEIGDSIAVNGVCLTVRSLDASGFVADVMPETCARSTLGTLRCADAVNLERALRLADRLGGHIVSGHIDSTGQIKSITQDDNAVRIRVAANAQTMKYVVEKGSVALDGISLTVALITDSSFEVSIIPHTFENTTLSSKRVNDKLNIECDIIGKYVEKLIAPSKCQADRSAQHSNGISKEFLAEMGF